MKIILKNMACRIWLGVTAVVLVIALIVNVFLCTTFKTALSQLFGEGAVELVGENESAFDKDFATKADALANGNEVSKRICEEGFTLLKNKDGALPLSERETRVSVFGKNSDDMAIGGSGSGGSIGEKATTVFDSLAANGFTYNPTLAAFYADDARSGKGRDANPKDMDNGEAVTLSEGETPLSKYTDDVWSSCEQYKDVALIVITRIGGEGFDMPRFDDDHFLKLKSNELALIEKVKTLGFGKIVLVINAAATLELKEVDEDDKIDAILWTGFAGGNGMAAFGEILKGKTTDGVPFSPSGKTVDTYAADFTKNPTWENMGAQLKTNENLSGDFYLTVTVDKRTRLKKYVEKAAYFVDYEENIYVGYRYYETAYAEAEAGRIEYDYEEEVVYPFGYGLSYTKFDWTLVNKSELEDLTLERDTALMFKVSVKNSGTHAGRDVVQLYVTLPYLGGVEKPAKVLVGFAKTKLLAPGETDEVEITVSSPYDFASYDYKGANESGKRGYVTEAGAYGFQISSDAHTPVITVNAAAENNIYYEADPVTENRVENLFTDNEDSSLDSDTELGELLSRKDFDVLPVRRTEEERDVSNRSEWVKAIEESESRSNRPLKSVAMPVTNKDSGIKLIQLRGLDYDADEWTKFIDQLSVSEMSDLVNKGAFRTEAIARLGVPLTTAADGPVGFCNFISSAAVYDTCKYPCEVVIASTWNVERARDMGVAVGNEGLIGNEKGDKLPYSGWYAPGLNIHRTPFGGRNFEYYSEDPLLSGALTAAVAEGAASKGVWVAMKHFALNEQETHRSSNGLLTWATEQSMREIYLKAFEIAVKKCMANDVKTLGIMSSFNRIGEYWTGGDYRLLTTILREEWGFKGLVICDFNTCSHMVNADMHYAGGDLNLELAGLRVWKPDAKNATDVTVLKQASKNILYVIANSNAMRGDFILHMPTWRVFMIVVDVVLFVGLSAWGVAVIIRALKKKNFESEAETGGSDPIEEK